MQAASGVTVSQAQLKKRVLGGLFFFDELERIISSLYYFLSFFFFFCLFFGPYHTLSIRAVLFFVMERGLMFLTSGVIMFLAWFAVKTSNSIPDTAIGRITHGTRLLMEGGFEGVYKQTFGNFVPGETLKKTYACHLSTSNGAVGGTLYITNKKFAFCSDRELTYYPTPGQAASSYYKVPSNISFSTM